MHVPHKAALVAARSAPPTFLHSSFLHS